MKKLASVLICSRSPAYESAVFWVHIFFCILHVGFYCLSFRVANVCHVQYFSGKSKISNRSRSSNNEIMRTLLSRRAAIKKEEQERYPYNLQFYIDFYRDHGSLSINCYI